jgi:hypothetical protein
LLLIPLSLSGPRANYPDASVAPWICSFLSFVDHTNWNSYYRTEWNWHLRNKLM